MPKRPANAEPARRRGRPPKSEPPRRRGRPPKDPSKKPKPRETPASESAARKELQRQLMRHLSTQQKVFSRAMEHLQRTQQRMLTQVPELLADRRTVAAWRTVIPAGGSHTFELGPEARVMKPRRLHLMPPHAGLLVDSIRVAAQEELAGAGVPAPIFGFPDSLQLPNFGPGDSVTLRNTTPEALDVTVAMAGLLETDRQRADRLETLVHELRVELELARRQPPTAAELARREEAATKARAEQEESAELQRVYDELERGDAGEDLAARTLADDSSNAKENHGSAPN